MKKSDKKKSKIIITKESQTRLLLLAALFFSSLFIFRSYLFGDSVMVFDDVGGDTWKKTKVLGGTYEIRELLVPVIKEGKRVYESPSVMELRDYCQKEQNTLWDESRRFVNPQKVYVDLSQKLWDLKKDLLEEMSEKSLD